MAGTSSNSNINQKQRMMLLELQRLYDEVTLSTNQVDSKAFGLLQTAGVIVSIFLTLGHVVPSDAMSWVQIGMLAMTYLSWLLLLVLLTLALWPRNYIAVFNSGFESFKAHYLREDRKACDVADKFMKGYSRSLQNNIGILSKKSAYLRWSKLTFVFVVLYSVLYLILF